MRKLFIICRKFDENSGSYAGVIEQFSRNCESKYKIKILCGKFTDQEKAYQKLNYAEIIRFKVPNIRFPGLGMNLQYLILSYKVKKYLKSIDNEGTYFANGRAALSILDRKYILRIGQPAQVFLKNMELFDSSLLTKIFRKIHFNFQCFLEKKIVNSASGIMYSSIQSKKLNEFFYGEQNKKYFIPISGIRYNEFSNPKKIILKGKNILFVSAGNEKIRKGIPYLEKALPKLFTKYNDLNLLHIGEHIRWNVPDKFLDRIISLGKIKWSEMPKYFYSSDIVIIPSLHEIIPNVLIEAMASKSVIAVSNMEGINEYIDHKKSGYIFNRGDSKEIVKAVSYLLDNHQITKKFGYKAQEKIKNLEYTNFSKYLAKFLEEDVNINLINKGSNIMMIPK